MRAYACRRFVRSMRGCAVLRCSRPCWYEALDVRVQRELAKSCCNTRCVQTVRVRSFWAKLLVDYREVRGQRSPYRS